MDVPAEVATAAGVVPSTARPLPWRHPLWLVECDGEPAVLRRYPPHRRLDDLGWEHHLLDALAPRFPVPRPLRLFVADDLVWSVVTYLPGRTPGWEEYDLATHGAFLARFHVAAEGLRPPPRPDPVPALDALGYRLPPTGLVHGDATTLNVVVDGDPPHPVGLIDFAMAHTSAPVADLAFALWQAGRAHADDVALDPSRVTAMVAGYRSVLPLDADTAELLPALITARGHQLIARWTARGVMARADPRTRARLAWTIDHRTDLRQAVAAALR